MKFLKDRKFDPDGLLIVLIASVIPFAVIAFFVMCVCYPKIVALLCSISFGIVFVFLIVWMSVTALKNAFNMIFPKKEDYSK